VISAVLRPGPAPAVTAGIARDQPAPAFAGTTLEGVPIDLASFRGRPVVLNFWGPSCVPCRTEFALLAAKLKQHAADDLAVIGILMWDPPDLARDFATELRATWATVQDPYAAIRKAYRVVARPQSYFIDRDGVLRAIQVGELDDARFERLYASIAPPAGSSPSPAAATP
jgi:cytochrome c biogenesis protein CcmG/thiol:disulfide interchange protein DsbE